MTHGEAVVLMAGYAHINKTLERLYTEEKKSRDILYKRYKELLEERKFK